MKKQVLLAGIGLFLLTGSAVAQEVTLPPLPDNLKVWISRVTGSLGDIKLYNDGAYIGRIDCYKNDNGSGDLDRTGQDLQLDASVSLSGLASDNGSNNWFHMNPDKCVDITARMAAYITDTNRKVVLDLDAENNRVTKVGQGHRDPHGDWREDSAGSMN